LNYKDLFKRAILLISSPAKAWEEISLEEDKRKVLTAFVYPMIGLCGLAYFIGSLLNNEINNVAFQKALTVCCAALVSLFGGYFLSAYIINKVGAEKYGLPNDLAFAQQFAGYALVVTFLLNIVTGLISSFFILRWIFQFYIVYIVWEGARVLLHIDERKQMSFTVVTSLILILCPAVLEFIFNRLIVILN